MSLVALLANWRVKLRASWLLDNELSYKQAIASVRKLVTDQQLDSPLDVSVKLHNPS